VYASLSFFCCDGAQRHLHSFPTRRSSDLEPPLPQTHARGVDYQPDRRCERPTGGVAVVQPHRQASAISGFSSRPGPVRRGDPVRSEEHTSELQSRENLVCRLLLEKKKSAT